MKRFIVSLIGISLLPAAIVAAPSAFQTAVLNDNPYAYYRFGESSGTTAVDSSGNSRDGSYINSPTLGVPGAGAGSDTAATFSSASSQYMDSSIPGFGSLLGNSTAEFLFSTTSTSSMDLAGTFNTGSVTGWEISLNRDAVGHTGVPDSLRIYLRDDNGVQVGAAFTDASAFDGNFHDLAFTYDSSAATQADQLKAYLDGVQQTLSFSTSSTPSAFSDFSYDAFFAANDNRGTANNFADVTLDEVALYSSALSGSQLAAHVAAVPEPGSMALVSLAGGILLLFRRRQKGKVFPAA